MEGGGVEREQLSIYHVAQLTWTKRQSQILDTTIGEKKPATDWYISPEKNLDSEGEWPVLMEMQFICIRNRRYGMAKVY